jgi:hypothetical protein
VQFFGVQGVIVATGQLHTTFTHLANANETTQLMLCLKDLPAPAPIPLDTLKAGIEATDQNISYASGTMTIDNVTLSDGCAGTRLSLEAAATLAAILLEEVEHWHNAFPQFGIATLVCLTVTIDPSEHAHPDLDHFLDYVVFFRGLIQDISGAECHTHMHAKPFR